MSAKIALLINADPDFAPVALKAVIETGHGLRTAGSSREAFRILSDGIHNVDVIIIDLDPGVHGLALLSALEVCDKSIPVITITGLDPDYIRPVVRRHGAQDCLGKPVGVEELVEAIMNCHREHEEPLCLAV